VLGLNTVIQLRFSAPIRDYCDDTHASSAIYYRSLIERSIELVNIHITFISTFSDLASVQKPTKRLQKETNCQIGLYGCQQSLCFVYVNGGFSWDLQILWEGRLPIDRTAVVNCPVHIFPMMEHTCINCQHWTVRPGPVKLFSSSSVFSVGSTKHIVPVICEINRCQIKAPLNGQFTATGRHPAPRQ
jgi:hypothetical protein